MVSECVRLLFSSDSNLPPSVQYFGHSNTYIQLTCGKLARLPMSSEIDFLHIASIILLICDSYSQCCINQISYSFCYCQVFLIQLSLPMEFVSCTRLARDGSYRLHGVNSISFFLAIFLQVLKWSEERTREEKSVTYLLTCRQYQTRMKSVQRREQC